MHQPSQEEGTHREQGERRLIVHFVALKDSPRDHRQTQERAQAQENLTEAKQLGGGFAPVLEKEIDAHPGQDGDREIQDEDAELHIAGFIQHGEQGIKRP